MDGRKEGRVLGPGREDRRKIHARERERVAQGDVDSAGAMKGLVGLMEETRSSHITLV